MGAFNVVENVPAVCPRCNSHVSVGVQFKFGATWQYSYVLGDRVRWGRSEIGRPGCGRVVADGVADADCPVCGYSGDWGFYVFIEHDRIVQVAEADGTYDFVRASDTYLELE